MIFRDRILGVNPSVSEWSKRRAKRGIADDGLTQKNALALLPLSPRYTEYKQLGPFSTVVRAAGIRDDERPQSNRDPGFARTGRPFAQFPSAERARRESLRVASGNGPNPKTND